MRLKSIKVTTIATAAAISLSSCGVYYGHYNRNSNKYINNLVIISMPSPSGYMDFEPSTSCSFSDWLTTLWGPCVGTQAEQAHWLDRGLSLKVAIDKENVDLGALYTEEISAALLVEGYRISVKNITDNQRNMLPDGIKQIAPAADAILFSQAMFAGFTMNMIGYGYTPKADMPITLMRVRDSKILYTGVVKYGSGIFANVDPVNVKNWTRIRNFNDLISDSHTAALELNASAKPVAAYIAHKLQ